MLPTDVTCAGYKTGDGQVPGLVLSSSQDVRGVIHVTVCNLDPNKNAKFVCTLAGKTPSSVSDRVLTHKAINAHNTFESPEVIKPVVLRELKVDGHSIKGLIPAKSVVVLAVQ